MRKGLWYTFERNVLPLVELLDKIKEAHCTIRMPYPPSQCAFVEQVQMRRGQDPKRDLIAVVYFRAKHNLEVSEEAVLEEPFVEFLGVRGDVGEVVSDGDLIVADDIVLQSVSVVVQTG
jgi:hypothetical protein